MEVENGWKWVPWLLKMNTLHLYLLEHVVRWSNSPQDLAHGKDASRPPQLSKLMCFRTALRVWVLGLEWNTAKKTLKFHDQFNFKVIASIDQIASIHFEWTNLSGIACFPQTSSCLFPKKPGKAAQRNARNAGRGIASAWRYTDPARIKASLWTVKTCKGDLVGWRRDNKDPPKGWIKGCIFSP